MIKYQFSCEIRFSEIPKKRLYLGIFLILFSALSIYSILYITREAFRLLSITEDFEFWVLTDYEIDFYNLFYAYISLIFAQSIGIHFWFNRPRRFFEKKYSKRVSIRNDNSVLNWYFINWFAKLSLLYMIMFGLAFHKAYYVFSFYPVYNYLFILIIIVLFFQTWLTLRIRFNKNSLKWMLISAFVISFLAFLLSFVNLVDFNEISENIRKKCVICKYDLQLPQTKKYEKLEKLSLVENIIVANNQNGPVLIIDNKLVKFEDLENRINSFQSQVDEADFPFLTFRLNIDKRVKMEYINKLKKKLSYCYFSKIAYAVLPNELKYNRKYYQNLSVKSYIHSPYSYEYLSNESIYFSPPPQLEIYERILNSNTLLIRRLKTKEYLINDTVVSLEDFQDYISQFVETNDNYLFIVHINDNDTFQDFFEILTECRNVIYEKREIYSLSKYKLLYKELELEIQKEIKKKFPMNIIDLTDEMVTKLNKLRLN